MKIGLFIDRIEELRVGIDSSCLLASEAERRGHEIFYFHIGDIFFEDDEVYADGSYISLSRNDEGTLSFSYQSDQIPTNLKELDVLLIRKDPPISEAHLSVLYMFEKLAGKVLMVNDPVGIRNGHSKLQTFRFPQYLVPQMIASNKNHIRSFLAKHKDVILKPLHGMGGKGVMRLSENYPNLNSLVETMLHSYGGQLLVQKYIAEASQGEKRIFLFDGDVHAAILKKPKEGDFRGNITAGASLEQVALSKRDHEICDVLKPYLKENGLFFVGLDLIGPYITEINSISPGAVSWANKVLDFPLEKAFWDAVEKKL